MRLCVEPRRAYSRLRAGLRRRRRWLRAINAALSSSTSRVTSSPSSPRARLTPGVPTTVPPPPPPSAPAPPSSHPISSLGSARLASVHTVGWTFRAEVGMGWLWPLPSPPFLCSGECTLKLLHLIT
ncbi:hypothetical protein ABZP36_020309 [Zizania latifolia]